MSTGTRGGAWRAWGPEHADGPRLGREDIDDLELDLPALCVAFGRRLHDAGLPVPAERCERMARALVLTRPVSRHRLYFVARAAFVSDVGQLPVFNLVFAEVFGGLDAVPELPPDALTRAIEAPEEESSIPSTDSGREPQDQLVPTLASSEEVLRRKRFDALEPHERAALRRLMARLAVSTPVRRSRRARRDRHGERIDMRRTLHDSMRTGGDPIGLARRRRRVLPRRLVLLCDISGSMEPYSRTYLQFMAGAAAGPFGAGRHEAFAFATRLTRLTRALHSRNPDRAIQRAARVAPDWSSGTRIGEALKTFNDRHGRRGMARGSVIVILSDGWERGDPALVGREMERLARVAYRIIWVNPRAAAEGFAPRAGGMAAALPWIDALLSGESLDGLEQVVRAIGAGADEALPSRDFEVSEPSEAEEADEPWASATPVAGSSVAMPSGWGPKRGRTTPGWTSGG